MAQESAAANLAGGARSTQFTAQSPGILIPATLEELCAELKQREELLRLASEAILIVDRSEKIAFWNIGAERLYGWSASEALGQSPIELLQTQLPRPVGQIENILRKESYWDGELVQTSRYGKHLIVMSRWSAWRDASGAVRGRYQLDTDITRRKKVEQELRVLSGRLLTIRDEERRRWARELHDSVGQLLIAATMNLSFLDKTTDQKHAQECTRLINEALQEIRTISYLLHPPMLDEVGLSSALRWYVKGFSDRSQIQTDLEVPENLGRFRQELEIAVFRIIQESLTNVHKHSGSASARITIAKQHNQLRVKIEDRGKGMVLLHEGEAHGANAIPGVGISGIRERVRQLKGQMQLRSSTSGSTGTTLEVLFPLEEGQASERASD